MMTGSFIATRVDKRRRDADFNQGDDFRIRVSNSYIVLNKALSDCVGERRLDMLHCFPEAFGIELTDNKLGLMFPFGRRAITKPVRKWLVDAKVEPGVYRCTDEDAAKVLLGGGVLSFSPADGFSYAEM